MEDHTGRIGKDSVLSRWDMVADGCYVSLSEISGGLVFI